MKVTINFEWRYLIFLYFCKSNTYFRILTYLSIKHWILCFEFMEQLQLKLPILNLIKMTKTNMETIVSISVLSFMKFFYEIRVINTAKKWKLANFWWYFTNLFKQNARVRLIDHRDPFLSCEPQKFRGEKSAEVSIHERKMKYIWRPLNEYS